MSHKRKLLDQVHGKWPMCICTVRGKQNKCVYMWHTKYAKQSYVNVY